jgi:arylsulfatase A-like enzyme
MAGDSTSTGQRRRPRNILIILSDQQRPDTIGAYWQGDEHRRRHAASAVVPQGPPGALPRTPHLDRLAATGALFERAYCAQPVCAPSRASILTGLHPHAHGLQDGDVLSPDVPTLAELLRPAGYACGYIGQWHLGHENRPQRGFEDFWVATEDGYIRDHDREGYTAYREYLVTQGYTPPDPHRNGTVFGRLTAARLPEAHGKPAYEAARAIEFLERFRERPFFLLVTFIEPHPPVTGPFDGLFAPEAMSLPDTWDREPDPTMPLRYRLRRQEVVETRKYLPGDDVQSWKAYKARYWGQCSLVDKYAGRILQRLDELGLEDDTVVAYSTDHGDMMGEHRMLNKGVAYEGATRVPLLIRAPGLAPRRLHTPATLVQLAPTLLDLAGQPVAPHLQGASLAPLIRDGDTAPDAAEAVVEWIGHSGYPSSLFHDAGLDESNEEHRRVMETAARTIRRGRWKLTVHLSGEHQLFDLEDDPGETTNLRGRPDHQETLRFLYARLQKWQRETRDDLALPPV